MISERIKEKAKEVGLSQVQIAKALNIKRGAVNQWFTGATKPNGENNQS